MLAASVQMGGMLLLMGPMQGWTHMLRCQS